MLARRRVSHRQQQHQHDTTTTTSLTLLPFVSLRRERERASCFIVNKLCAACECVENFVLEFKNFPSRLRCVCWRWRRCCWRRVVSHKRKNLYLHAPSGRLLRRRIQQAEVAKAYQRPHRLIGSVGHLCGDSTGTCCPDDHDGHR